MYKVVKCEIFSVKCEGSASPGEDTHPPSHMEPNMAVYFFSQTLLRLSQTFQIEKVLGESYPDQPGGG